MTMTTPECAALVDLDPPPDHLLAITLPFFLLIGLFLFIFLSQGGIRELRRASPQKRLTVFVASMMTVVVVAIFVDLIH